MGVLTMTSGDCEPQPCAPGTSVTLELGQDSRTESINTTIVSGENYTIDCTDISSLYAGKACSVTGPCATRLFPNVLHVQTASLLCSLSEGSRQACRLLVQGESRENIGNLLGP